APLSIYFCQTDIHKHTHTHTIYIYILCILYETPLTHGLRSKQHNLVTFNPSLKFMFMLLAKIVRDISLFSDIFIKKKCNCESSHVWKVSKIHNQKLHKWLVNASSSVCK